MKFLVKRRWEYKTLTNRKTKLKMKRKYIGSEISDEYIKVAENRIKATKGTLFDF